MGKKKWGINEKAKCVEDEMPGGVGNLIFQMSRLVSPFRRKDSIE